MGTLREAEKKIKTAIQHGIEAAQFLAKLKDTSVPSFTLFVREDIGIQKNLDGELKESDRFMGQVTAIYVPPSVTTTDKVNVILYLHGDKVRLWNEHGTIRDYLSLPAMPLREGLNKSGKPYVLVAPTLGASTAAEFGDLGTNIDQYLDDAMTRLFEYGPTQYKPPKPPQIADLIIAGHSGGYGAIRSILTNMKKYKNNIKEIWGFDIMYRNTADYMAAAAGPAGVPVYAYFRDTKAHAKDLASRKIANVFVMDAVEFFMSAGKEQRREIEHDYIMQSFWALRCQRIGQNGTNPEDKKIMI